VSSGYKWGNEPQTVAVTFFHRRVGELVQERLAASGKRWEEAVWDPSLELTKADFEKIEQELLATGHRFDFSARISLDEAPEKYRAVGNGAAAGELERDEQGRAVVGSGDNVFKADDVVGTARVISTIETVMEMLTEGVPEETVAIIDDSGGTLTAPILEGFTAVVCKGGTIRSHLGILTREYRIPCLMAAELGGLDDGDRVQVEYSAEPVSPYTSDESANVRARVWKLA
jgi:hypothetical protein